MKNRLIDSVTTAAFFCVAIWLFSLTGCNDLRECECPPVGATIINPAAEVVPIGKQVDKYGLHEVRYRGHAYILHRGSHVGDMIHAEHCACVTNASRKVEMVMK